MQTPAPVVAAAVAWLNEAADEAAAAGRGPGPEWAG